MNNAQAGIIVDDANNESSHVSSEGTNNQTSEQAVAATNINIQAFPPEIRRLIYTFFFQSAPYTLTRVFPSRFRGLSGVDELRTHRRDVHNLLLVRREVRNEVFSVFLQTSTFTMTAPRSERLYRRLPDRRAMILPSMQYLELEVTTSYEVNQLLQLLRTHRCNQLTSVVIRHRGEGFEDDLIKHIRIIDELNAQTGNFSHSFVCVGTRGASECDSQCMFSRPRVYMHRTEHQNEHQKQCRRPQSHFDWDFRRHVRDNPAQPDWSVNVITVLQDWLEARSTQDPSLAAPML